MFRNFFAIGTRYELIVGGNIYAVQPVVVILHIQPVRVVVHGILFDPLNLQFDLYNVFYTLFY